MKIDLTVLPAKVTITNINVKQAKVGEENRFEGQERIALYRVNQYVDLAAQDSLELVATESEALAFYKAQAKKGAIKVEVASM